MPRSIFVSYKYGDADVRAIQRPGSGLVSFVPTTARDYVDQLAAHLDANDHIYKGENDNESLAGFKNETIESKLREKIFGTSITIVLISKNMKDPNLSEDDQWIPWEVSYSLKEMTKGGRTSRTNGMLAVVLPDKNGGYGYFVNPICPNGCLIWQTGSTFQIMAKNMFNRKRPNTFYCSNHPNSGVVYSGNDHSYMYPVKWDDFIPNMNWYIDLAAQLSQNVGDYEIVKMV